MTNERLERVHIFCFSFYVFVVFVSYTFISHEGPLHVKE